MNRVWNDQSIKANKKLLLLALADFSNDEGVCYPSQDTLVKKCGLNKATVNKYIKEFEEQNILIQAKRNKKNGGRLSSKYLLFPEDNYEFLDEQDREIFEPKFTVQTNAQSLTGKPTNDTQSLTGKPKPSLIYYINHHLYKEMTTKEKDLFREYLDLRKQLRCKNTDAIVDRLLKKYFEYGRNTKVIENAIISNWKDFYQIKNSTSSSSKINKTFDTIDRLYGSSNNNDVVDVEVLHG